jgi:hypothetical protein
LPLMQLILLHHIPSESGVNFVRAAEFFLNFSQFDCDPRMGTESCGMVFIRDWGGCVSCN